MAMRVNNSPFILSWFKIINIKVFQTWKHPFFGNKIFQGQTAGMFS